MIDSDVAIVVVWVVNCEIKIRTGQRESDWKECVMVVQYVGNGTRCRRCSKIYSYRRLQDSRDLCQPYGWETI